MNYLALANMCRNAGDDWLADLIIRYIEKLELESRVMATNVERGK